MTKKVFNPADWLEKPAQPEIKQQVLNGAMSQWDEVEKIIRQIEDKQIDITSAYSDWRNIGFAFAEAFGEKGRTLFFRISRFYPDYSEAECNKQYDHCLKSKGQGVSLKTFFYHAKQAGLAIGTIDLPRTEEIQTHEQMPTLPDNIYPRLPEFFQKVVCHASSNEERDLLLLGSIAAMSACFPKVFGVYDAKKVFANIYLFVTAQASAGKGKLVHCKQLVKPVHRNQREQARLLKNQYEVDLAEYNATKGKEEAGEKPSKPAEKLLFIPANNSATGVFQLLSDNEGRGLIFETEGDTLAQAFKSDYGNYSDGFRKAFHHETISYYRRTDREYVDIESPCLSAVLSGTPKQVAALIPNAENGLFSRFLFYYMNVKPIWKDVFAHQSGEGLDTYFENLGEEFYQLYKHLGDGPEIQFALSEEQQSHFNKFFSQVQAKYLSIKGIDYMATVRRLGLVAFRICMVFSALRIMETGECGETLQCNMQDFETSLAIVSILVKHSSRVFSELPLDAPPPGRKNRKERFLESLPGTFNRQKYLDMARKLSVPEKTAEGYITEFCQKNLIHREHHDHYLNPGAQEEK
jgi:hypothetical protein